MMKCIKCQLELPESSFSNYRRSKTGKIKTCKKCMSEYHKKYFKKVRNEVKEFDYLSMSGTKNEDYQKMYQFMIQLGYDPTGDVSKQFCEKYGLKYKSRKNRDRNSFPYDPESI